jgi:hypothetical protein
LSKPIFGDGRRFGLNQFPVILEITRTKQRRPHGFFSIVIPCFNATATLGSTIKGALKQQGVPPDLVVVDNGSTDDSIGIGRPFEPRLQMLTGPDRGTSAARNRGIADTTGKWIVFLDVYDLLVFGTSRLRLETPEPSGADILVCDWQSFSTGDGTAGGAVTSVDLATKRMPKPAARRNLSAAGGIPCIDAAFSRKLAGSARRAPKVGVRPSTTIRLQP